MLEELSIDSRKRLLFVLALRVVLLELPWSSSAQTRLETQLALMHSEPKCLQKTELRTDVFPHPPLSVRSRVAWIAIRYTELRLHTSFDEMQRLALEAFSAR